MLSAFNIVRVVVFVAVIAWSLIVLGLAAFFDHLIIASEMTRFIPLAIFVAVCTLVIIPTLLLFGFLKRVLLISQARSELTFVGLLGILWFALAMYTSSEPETTISCDFDDSGDWDADTYSNNTYQLQYRVLKAFAILNAIILVLYFFLILLLCFRHKRAGRPNVWYSGITSFTWFGHPPPPPKVSKPKLQPMAYRQPPPPLPPPVTAKVTISAPMAKGVPPPTKAMHPGGQYIMYIPPPPPRRPR